MSTRRYICGNLGLSQKHFPFSHPGYRPPSAVPQSQDPRNSTTISMVSESSLTCSIGAAKSDLNLGANSAKLFLRRPVANLRP